MSKEAWTWRIPVSSRSSSRAGQTSDSLAALAEYQLCIIVRIAVNAALDYNIISFRKQPSPSELTGSNDKVVEQGKKYKSI